MAAPLVSVVIPCYNPPPELTEALASVRAQTHPQVEVVLVNDGTTNPAALERLRAAAATVTHYIEQPNQGLAAARNAGFRAAAGEFVVPLDADDRLEPAFITACLAEIERHPESAFVYTDYRVFGDVKYVERTPAYDLDALLDQNILIYAALIRRGDWDVAGGYDDSMRLGYEDWDFWLRLAERGRFGRHLDQVLFAYRKHGRSLLTLAREHHDELVAKIRGSHPALYGWPGRAQVKARWAPAVGVLGSLTTPQTIADWQALSEDPAALEQSSAAAFLRLDPAAAPEPHAAEWAALAVWGGHDALRLPFGTALSRQSLRAGTSAAPAPAAGQRSVIPGPLETIQRHLLNAELSWEHPVRSAVRLIPLRVKERVNKAAGRPVFDLSFYLQFQPQSVLTGESLVEPLRYLPPPATDRRRVALVTPHLGPGGAETVLLEIARALDRSQIELFVLTTQSRDDRWRTRWQDAADHVYDLAALVSPERLIPAIYSVAVNWGFDALVLQNSLAAYSALPHLKRALPTLRVADLIHAVDEDWDFVSATAPVAGSLDLRIAISQAGADRLRQAGVPPACIRLVRNGIDLERFGIARARPGARPNTILFAGRLDPVKRPLLLVEIAQELVKRRPTADFHFLVAGDGPERAALESRLAESGLQPMFTLLGMVDDVAPLLAESALVVVPSKAEGIPMIAIEAFAAARPVVCARVGAAAEVVSADTGLLVGPGPQEAARFAAALDSLISDPQRRHALGLAGRCLVEAEYDSTRARRAYREILLALLERADLR